MTTRIGDNGFLALFIILNRITGTFAVMNICTAMLAYKKQAAAEQKYNHGFHYGVKNNIRLQCYYIHCSLNCHSFVNYYQPITTFTVARMPGLFKQLLE